MTSEVILKTIFLFGLATAWWIRVQFASRVRPYWRGRKIDRRLRMADVVLTELSFLAMQVLPIFYLFTPWLNFANYRLHPAAGSAGVVLFFIAIWLLWRAHMDLGRNWNALVQLRQGHALVTGGIYSKVRHPMYAAHFLWAIAQPLIIQNWIAGLTFLPIFIIFYLVRVPNEEQMMLDHFGDTYRSYMSRTGRILPKG